ncbi:aspartyl-phosphate phosphatase Spo0E family protein [Alkaliphilus transvaalensis]|nr:aspartyl-phosphate phosphatase Spo0E family protein [Alkaliphilus transvaalensis]
MLEQEIALLKKRLNELIDQQVDYKEIYNLSTQLDSLIVAYYRKIAE